MEGIFFCYQDKIYAKTISFQNEDVDFNEINTDKQHEAFWNESMQVLFPGEEYSDFFRGRVVCEGGVYKIFYDKCLSYNITVIYEILKAFKISKKKWATYIDRQYQCAACQAIEKEAIVFNAYEEPSYKRTNIFSDLDDEQILQAFEKTKEVFEKMSGHKGFEVRLLSKAIKIFKNGNDVTKVLATSGSQVLELAMKIALATIKKRQLVLIYPTSRIGNEERKYVDAFIKSLPTDKVIISEPFKEWI